MNKRIENLFDNYVAVFLRPYPLVSGTVDSEFILLSFSEEMWNAIWAPEVRKN